MKNQMNCTSANGTPMSKILKTGLTIIFCGLFGLLNMSFEMADQPAAAYALEEVSCPTADFNFSHNGCAASCPVTFMNLSSGATSYLWDFGDGISSVQVSPLHVYQSAGVYEVKLTAYVEGCQVTNIIIVDLVNL